jgi:hypothetical protein
VPATLDIKSVGKRQFLANLAACRDDTNVDTASCNLIRVHSLQKVLQPSVKLLDWSTAHGCRSIQHNRASTAWLKNRTVADSRM